MSTKTLVGYIWGCESYKLIWVHKISPPQSFLTLVMQMLDLLIKI